MRKLLTLISAVGLGATGTVAASNVVSCSKKAANDLGKLKKDDLKIAIDKKDNNTKEFVIKTILDKINEKVLINKDGKEVKKDDKDKLTFVEADFTFKIGKDDFAFPTKDLDQTFDVTVAPVSGDSATDNAKALKGSATFTVTPKNDAQPDPTPAAKKTMTSDAASNKLSVVAAATQTINITPASGDSLAAVKAVSKDPTKATVSASDLAVTVTGVTAGKTNVTISADGYNDLVIEVTVTAATL